MQTQKDEYQYLEFKNGKVGDLLTLEQVSERIKGLVPVIDEKPVPPTPIVVEPVKPDYIAMQKRVRVGDKNKRPQFTAMWGGVSHLIDQVSTNPDAFFVRGFNFDYTPSLGAKPTGPKTEWGGLAEPAGTVKPEGFRIRYPKDAKTPADRYYELSDQPDEVFVAPVKPVTPTPEPPKHDQVKTAPATHSLGNLFTGNPNDAQ